MGTVKDVTGGGGGGQMRRCQLRRRGDWPLFGSGGLRLFWTRNVTLVLIGEHVRERAAAAADVEHLLDAVEGHALDEALGGRHRPVVLRSRKTHGEMWEEVGRDIWEKWGVGGRKIKRLVGEMGCGWAGEITRQTKKDLRARVRGRHRGVREPRGVRRRLAGGHHLEIWGEREL